jgi:hypothetical protein
MHLPNQHIEAFWNALDLILPQSETSKLKIKVLLNISSNEHVCGSTNLFKVANVTDLRGTRLLLFTTATVLLFELNSC